jgi:hypothetical protein
VGVSVLVSDQGAKPSRPEDIPERRSDPRSLADQPATIKLLSPLEAASRIPARIIEISRSGLRLRVERGLMPGAIVQIRVGEKLLMGEVRYSNPEGEKFQVGVRLHDVFETGP